MVSPTKTSDSSIIFSVGTRKPEKPNRRSIVPYSVSNTAAYIPKSLTTGDLKKPIEDTQTFPKVDSKLMKALQEDIENHCERRLQIMFLQFVLAYRSGLSFTTKVAADLQIGQGKNKPNPYAACHVATTPSLSFSHRKNIWIFGKGTSLYPTFNETILLPAIVNQVDSSLDLHHKKMGVSRALRERSISILNDLAKPDSKMNPKEGFLRYLNDSKDLFKALKEAKLKPHQKSVVQTFNRTVVSYQKQLEKGDEIIKALFSRSQKVDDEFFKNVQSEIYQRLIKEVEGGHSSAEVIYNKTSYSRKKLTDGQEAKSI